MGARVVGVSVATTKKGRAHFPEALEQKIDPPKDNPNVPKVEGGYAHGLNQFEISELVHAAENEGFGRGAVVAIPGANYISADTYNWGIVTGLNYAVPSRGAPYPGPIMVTWPFKIGKEKVETRHFIEELYLVYRSPTRKDIDEYTAEMKEQFAASRS